MTYRLSDHTTADDARRYRSDEDVSTRWQEEPVKRLRAYLVAAAAWQKEDELAMLADCRKEVEQAVEAYLERAPAPPTDMLDFLYARLPSVLDDQRATLAGTGGRNHG